MSQGKSPTWKGRQTLRGVQPQTAHEKERVNKTEVSAPRWRRVAGKGAQHPDPLQAAAVGEGWVGGTKTRINNTAARNGTNDTTLNPRTVDTGPCLNLHPEFTSEFTPPLSVAGSKH